MSSNFILLGLVEPALVGFILALFQVKRPLPYVLINSVIVMIVYMKVQTL